MENFKIVELTCKQMKSLNNNIFNFSKQRILTARHNIRIQMSIKGRIPLTM